MAKKRPPRSNKRGSRSGKVGYGNPPDEHKFKPGQSGNPSGKRKGTRDFASTFADVRKSKLWMVSDGKRRRVTSDAAVAAVIKDGAIKGLAKRLDQYVKLAIAADAADRRRAALRSEYGFRIIDETMTPKEAAEEYAKTLAAAPGLSNPDFTIDFDEDESD